MLCGCGAQDVTTSSSGGGLSGDHTEVLILGQRHSMSHGGSKLALGVHTWSSRSSSIQYWGIMVGGVAVRQTDWWMDLVGLPLRSLYIIPGEHRVGVADWQVNRQNGSGSPYLEFWVGLSFIC